MILQIIMTVTVTSYVTFTLTTNSCWQGISWALNALVWCWLVYFEREDK